MAIIKNDRDIFLQAQSPRLVPASGNYILLSASSPVFKLTNTGTLPSQIVIVASLVGYIYGTISFTVTSGTATLSVSGNQATILPASMTTDSVTIQASVTCLGSTYTATTTISKINEIAVLNISKDTLVVNSNADGSSPVLTNATSTAQVIVGITDVTDTWSYVWTTVSGTGTYTGNTTKTITVTGITTDSLVLQCKASKTGFPDLIKQFNISKNKLATNTYTAYQRSLTQPSTPASSATLPPSGWSSTTPASGSGLVYATYGTKLGVDTIYTWTTPVQIEGTASIVGDLTNATHAVSANNDGTGYTLTNSGGSFIVYLGQQDITSLCTFSITNATTNPAPPTGYVYKVSNGLTLQLATTGVGIGTYSLSGSSWTTDSEQFTLNATYGTTTISQTYSITKFKTGNPALYAKINSSSNILSKSVSTYAASGTYSPSSITFTGKLVDDSIGTLTDWGYLSYKVNGTGTESAKSRYTLTYTPSATNVEYIRVYLYDDTSGTTLIDYEDFPVVLSGASAPIFSITAASAVFNKATLTNAITPTSIALTTNIINATSPTYVWKKNGVVIAGATTSSYNIPSSDYSSVSTNTYRCECTAIANGVSVSLYDEITIPLLSDGSNAVSVVATNESITFPATNSGYAGITFTNGACDISVYIGSTQLTCAASGANTFSVSLVNTSVTVSGSDTGTNYTIAAPTAMSADSAYTTATITVRDATGNTYATVNKKVSYSLSRTGATGATGATGPAGANGVDGATGPRTAFAYFYYSTAQSTAPTAPTTAQVSYTFSTNTPSTTAVGWSSTFSPGALSSTTGTNKYWAVRVSFSEVIYGGTQNTPVVTAPFNWQNLDGLVTFTNLSSGLGSNGVASTTLINGGCITANTIKVDSLTSGATTGLTNGQFALGSASTINGQAGVGLFKSNTDAKWGVCVFNDATGSSSNALGAAARPNAWAAAFYSVKDANYNTFNSLGAFGYSANGGIVKLIKSTGTLNDPITQNFIANASSALASEFWGTNTWAKTYAYLATSTYAGMFVATGTSASNILTTAYIGYSNNYGVYCPSVATNPGNNRIYAADGFTPFTGAHDGLISDIYNNIIPGDILVDTQVLKHLDISNSVVLVTPSISDNQKGVLGVLNKVCTEVPEDWKKYSQKPVKNFDATTDEYRLGIVSPPDPFIEIEENPQYFPIPENHSVVLVNAIGEGLINVCGLGGNISTGDLIVTSTIQGKGKKQSDDLVHSYTVAKARESVYFDYPEQIKQIACIYMCG